MNRAHLRWVLTATILASSMGFIDGTVVNIALPALQATMGATITDVQWVVEAYTLFLGSLMLTGGALGDRFGRKRVFLSGVAMFTAGSMACGLAPNMDALIAFRALQGIGAALMVPGSLAIISATFDEAERGRAIGTWSGFGAITSAIGPVAGGWLTEHVSWRAVFFINVPLAAIVLVLAARFVSESRDDSRSSRVDWTGAVLEVINLGAVVFALLEWPRLETDRRVVIGAMTTGVVLLAALVIVERRVPTPMLPLRLFTSRTFTLANLLTLLLYGALAMVLWLLPMDLIQVKRYTATAAGAALLPLPLLLFALSRWSGGLAGRVGSRLPLTVGPVIVAAGLALLARAGSGGSYWTTVFPAVTVLGLGMALVVAPLTTTAMGAVEAQHAGVASGVNNAVSRVAGLIAIALLGIVLVRSFDGHVIAALDRLGLSAPVRASIDRELPKLAGADVDAAVGDEHRAAVRRAIDDSFAASFRLVMNLAAVMAAAAAVAGAFLPGAAISPNG
jgi:EmrB/QacA subfamily drug resistance transporter